MAMVARSFDMVSRTFGLALHLGGCNRGVVWGIYDLCDGVLHYWLWAA